MSVRKIHNWWWVDFRNEGVRCRRRSPENSNVGAKAFELVLRQRLARGEPIDGRAEETSPTFEAFAREWLKTYVRTNNKPSEQRAKDIILRRHLGPCFGGQRLDQITCERIEQYKSHKLQTGLSPKSINNQLSVMRKCLNTAVEWDYLSHVPRIRLLHTISQRLQFLSLDECKRILEDRTEPMWYAMATVALHTGLRLGELFALEWSDVDLVNHVLTIQRSTVRGITSTPKSNRIRYVPLSPIVEQALSHLGADHSLIFHRGNGQPLSYRIAEHAIHRLCKRADIRSIGWHTLRHTFASQLVAHGVSLRAVQLLLGHSSVVVTERYAHLAPSRLQEAVAVLQQALSSHDKVGQPVGNSTSAETSAQCPALPENPRQQMKNIALCDVI